MRGDTTVIVERHRPDRPAPPLRGAPPRGRARRRSCPLLQDNGRPGGEGLRIDQAVRRALQAALGALAAAGQGPAPALPGPAADRDHRGAGASARCCRPSSSSSAAPPATTPCARCLRDGVRLTDAAERVEIRAGAPSAGSSRSTTTSCGVLGYDEWLEGLERGRGRAPRRPGPRLPRDGGGLLRRRAAQGRLRHRDAVARDQHAGPVGGDRAVHQVRRGRTGHPHVGGVPPADRPGRAPGARRGGPRRGRVVDRDHLRRGGPRGVGPAAGPALVVPAHLQPGRQPGARASTASTANAVLHRSFAQWQARTARPAARASWAPGRRPRADWATSTGWSADGAGPPAVPHLPRGRPPDRRGARQRRAGRRRARRAGRRAVGRRLRATPSPPRAGPRRAHRRRASSAGPAAGPPGRQAHAPSWPGAATPSTPGRADPGRRGGAPRAPDPPAGARPGHRGGLVGPGGLLLDRPRRSPARDVGELAPGDFVRTMKSVADLAQQVSHTAVDTAVAARGPARPSTCCSGASSRVGCRGPEPIRHRRVTLVLSCAGHVPLRRRALHRRRGGRSSAATSPTSTSRSLPWSTCPKSSKGPSSPATPARPRACGDSSSTSSSGELDVSGDADGRRHHRPARAPRSSTSGSSSSTATTRWPSSVASTWPASRRPTCSPRCSSGDGSWPTSSSRRATSRYDQRLDNGHYRYYRPPEIARLARSGPATSATWTACSTPTARSCPRMQAWVAERFPQQAGDSDFVYRQAIRAKSLDALRGLLPAASLSNVGIYGTGQSYEQLLLRMRAHPLPEARRYADMMLDELRKVIPSFLQRVDVPERGGEWSDYLADTATSTDAGRGPAVARPGPRAAAVRAEAGEPRSTLARLRPRRRGEGPGGGLFLPPAAAPSARRLRRVRPLGHEDRRRAPAGVRRGPAQPPPPPGSGLRAHRLPLRPRLRLRRLPRPAASPHAHHRVAAPRHRARLRHARRSWPRPASATATTRPIGRARGPLPRPWRPTSPSRRSYAVALAYRIRYVMQMNAREAMHLIELRSGTQGHPAYRRVAQEMHRAIAERAGHRALAEAMTFVDHGATDLERLESERAGRAPAVGKICNRIDQETTRRSPW